MQTLSTKHLNPIHQVALLVRISWHVHAGIFIWLLHGEKNKVYIILELYFFSGGCD